MRPRFQRCCHHAKILSWVLTIRRYAATKIGHKSVVLQGFQYTIVLSLTIERRRQPLLNISGGYSPRICSKLPLLRSLLGCVRGVERVRTIITRSDQELTGRFLY